jgi:hypothetical protein
MSLLDWEKKKYERSMQAITERREALYENLLRATGQLRVAPVGRTIEEALKMPFKVCVVPMQASNGLSYFVSLERTDGEKRPTFRHEGRISVINRHNVDEANAEGYAWAAFLGVPFVACEKREDTAPKNTVPEYGPSQVEDAVGLKQVVEWAGAYVDNESIVPHVPFAELSVEEQAGVRKLEELEDGFGISHNAFNTSRIPVKYPT